MGSLDVGLSLGLWEAACLQGPKWKVPLVALALNMVCKFNLFLGFLFCFCSFLVHVAWKYFLLDIDYYMDIEQTNWNALSEIYNVFIILGFGKNAYYVYRQLAF